MAYDTSSVSLGAPTRKSDYDRLMDNIIDLAGSGRTDESVKANADAGNPTAIIIAFGGTSAPTGYLFCDGAAINRVTYAALYAAIGDAYGEGDGSTTFNIPDTRGLFLRGVDHSRGNDPDAAARIIAALGGNTGDTVGSKQLSAMWGHWHRNYGSTNTLSSVSASGGTTGGGDMRRDASRDQGRAKEILTDGVHGTPNLTSESRPINLYVNHIIKY